MLKNLWQHPQTTVAGILIAVVTICGALEAQGVTGAHLGAGTTVTLIAGVASALLGLVSKDPGAPTQSK
jgi:Na+-transporting NADH:ubiquinone oxidoreductase subunit NqrD